VWRVCKLVHLYENYWERKKEKLECQMTEKLHKVNFTARERERESAREREGDGEGGSV
jgi:hypothetical protein